MFDGVATAELSALRVSFHDDESWSKWIVVVFLASLDSFAILVFAFDSPVVVFFVEFVSECVEQSSVVPFQWASTLVSV